jgi:hypothetical protein
LHPSHYWEAQCELVLAVWYESVLYPLGVSVGKYNWLFLIYRIIESEHAIAEISVGIALGSSVGAKALLCLLIRLLSD